MTTYPSNVDWVQIAPQVVLELLGEPKVKKGDEWRYGNKGSLVVNIENATWFDFENDEGGGIVDLIKRESREVNDILNLCGYDLAPQPFVVKPPSVGAKSISNAEMHKLQSEAIISLRYSPDFVVMRFPENHKIKQKYAPFTKMIDGKWCMKRPDGLLPIYFKNQYPDKPILINEGEKATVASEKIWQGDSVTWHGGVNAWQKADWSPIEGREVIIFPDNDEAGKKCANDLSEHLRRQKCKVKVVEPPKDFAEKDDLYDALQSNYFKTPEELVLFINKQEQKIPRGSLRFQTVKEAILNVENPKWLIEGCFEQEKLITVFGEPKSGKSFIAIAMACAVASGTEFYGCKANRSNVIYLAGEGLSGMRKRLLAFHQSSYGHKLFFTDEEKKANTKLQDAQMFLSNRGARINEEDEYKKLEDEINLIKEQSGDIGLIIFDTFQRSFSGDENSAQEVNKFVKAADQLIHEYKCAVLLVHHTGRGNLNRARGSSVLDASIDGEFKVKRKDDEGIMYVNFEQTKNKDGMGMTKKRFKFHEENLIGAGLEMTSGLLIEVDDDDNDNFEEFDNKAYLKGIDKKLVNLMYVMSKDNSEDVWFTWSKLEPHTSSLSTGEKLTKYKIDNSFRRLEAQNVIVHAKRDKDSDRKEGYRLVEMKPYED
tara:strand:- start:1857 stop:3818 length:1962 start_codon:yes stop_codon:yes gene_type:complete